MIHLKSLARKGGELPEEFPFNVPAVRSLSTLEFTTPVTFLVGENGSGKSTLIEALAAVAGLVTVGSHAVGDDPTLAHARRLAGRLKLSWSRRTHRGFFLRAEDFFGFSKHVSALRAEFEATLVELEEEYKDRSAYARGLAQGPARASLAELESRYGVDLDARSHGESFLKLFKARFVPGGLYVLDEPETPLSPQSQLAFLVMIKDMVEQDSQFVIASHSPILMAYPGATLYSLDREPIQAVHFDELDHVMLMRSFLGDPRQFLRRLGLD